MGLGWRQILCVTFYACTMPRCSSISDITRMIMSSFLRNSESVKLLIHVEQVIMVMKMHHILLTRFCSHTLKTTTTTTTTLNYTLTTPFIQPHRPLHTYTPHIPTQILMHIVNVNAPLQPHTTPPPPANPTLHFDCPHDKCIFVHVEPGHGKCTFWYGLYAYPYKVMVLRYAYTRQKYTLYLYTFHLRDGNWMLLAHRP